jgi:hypothetical protein
VRIENLSDNARTFTFNIQGDSLDTHAQLMSLRFNVRLTKIN